jgi:phosphoketolase
MLCVIGPGHGGPAALANSWLEGTYSEVYPTISRDAAGLHRLFRQFSFPGGVPSHVSPETPGSIHEGGELGYSLSHAHGAAFDNPGLIVACVVGDGDAVLHAARGAGIWEWASSDGDGSEPDVVLACAGDVPTLEVLGYELSRRFSAIMLHRLQAARARRLEAHQHPG